MSKNPLAALFPQQLSNRERIIVFVTLLVLVGAILYQFPYTRLTRSVGALASQASATEEEIRILTVQLADLRANEAQIRAALKSGITKWDLVDQKGVILFLDDVSSEARRQGVSLVSVHPAQEVDRDKYREVSLNLDLKGRYRELAEYFRKLENFSRIVNIRKIRVEACPDSSSACATQLEAVTYMEK